MRDLATLLVGDEPDDGVIALRGAERIDLRRFRDDIASNAARLAAANCRHGLLATADTYWCAVGMMALFRIGATVVMPQNATPGAALAIGGAWDLIITDRLDGDADGQFLLGRGDGAGADLRAIDPALCRLSLYTSGSTGRPKRVDKTLAAMQREALAIEAMLGSCVAPDSHVVGMVTHQHLFGLSFKLFWPLLSGRPFEARVYQYWEEVLAENIGQAAIVASPAHLKRLGDLLPDGKHLPPACLISAGAELSDAVAATVQEAFNAPLLEIYGSTETGIVGQRWRKTRDQPWLPAPGVAIDIGPNGALRIQSPFLDDPDWFDVDDRVEPADAGFRLKGRADRVVKIEGKRVSLPEVEATLAASPFVAQVAVLAVGAEGPTLAAVVVTSAEGARELTRLGAFRLGRELRRSLAARHEAAAIPRRWRFVQELPTGPLGKVRQEDLLALFADEQREPELLAMRRNGQELELDLFNGADLAQLDGHFPGMPIVPGVAQIDWAVKLAARYMGIPLASAQTYQVKFHRLTLPGMAVKLCLAHDEARQRLRFSYRRGDDVLTSGVIRLAAT
ncbi:AMP-binding protein [Dongia rigui]|uniref:AMP-binding protein n=1 Tax=Dongia rigui TaxID=940149 RepID=A0ABU5E150_9PROT|nr:AMP-binding protein [Dongia rigui]MDY0873329.1 AMP-binding protein [Dongia rigui]